MKKQLCGVVCVAALWATGMGSSALATTLDSTDQRLIDMAASINELALACGYTTAAQAHSKQAQQRKISLEQGLAPAAYDRAYAQAQRDFKLQWAAQTPQQQKARCDQVKR